MKKISYRPVYNRKNRLNKQGKALLQIEAYLEKRKVYFSSHIHLTPQQWDKRRERIVAHPNAEALNLMLATFMMELEQKELELWKNGQDITLEKLKETFIKENMHTFLEFAKREIEDSQLKESTRKNRLTTCYLLAKFKQRINFKDLTSKFIFEFESFLYQQGCHTNTVAKHMKHLKLLVNSAINKGYIEPGNYAFRRYRIKTEEGKHAFLRPEELEKLETIDTSLLTPVQKHTLDAFLFCCYTGLRYSDFRNLTTRNIYSVDGKPWIVFRTIKTNKEVRLPIALLFDGKALKLIQKYRQRLNSFFTVDSNSCLNKRLIHIGKKAGIQKHFSFHSARHTNATLLIYKGVSITTVQRLLGHRNLSTTQGYSEIMEGTIIKDLKRASK